MTRFVVHRIVQSALVVVCVVVFVFVVTRMIGDPVRVMLPLNASEAQREALTKQLGLDQSIVAQFLDYLRGLASLDLGQSLWQRSPALDIVLAHLPRTFQLVAAGMIFAIAVSLPLGIISALKPGSLVDRSAVTLGLIGMSLPQFWLGLLLILLFSVGLGWFPSSGASSPLHLVLPAVTLGLPLVGRLAMTIRSSLIDELNSQYVRTMKAKGMSRRVTIGRHALRNAAVPFVTMSGWEFIRAITGYAVVVETVFAWPGIGFLSLQTINRQDLVLLQAIALVVAVLVVIMNLMIDVTYKLIDPRIDLS